MRNHAFPLLLLLLPCLVAQAERPSSTAPILEAARSLAAEAKVDFIGTAEIDEAIPIPEKESPSTALEKLAGSHGMSVSTLHGITHFGPPRKAPAEKKGKAKDDGRARLLNAKAKHYDIPSSRLHHVVELLALEAKIPLTRLPDDDEIGERFITVNVTKSPFQALEAICEGNDLGLAREGSRWRLRRLTPDKLRVREYPAADPEKGHELAQSIQNTLNAGQRRKAEGPEAEYLEASQTIRVTATKRDHRRVETMLAASKEADPGLIPTAAEPSAAEVKIDSSEPITLDLNEADISLGEIDTSIIK